MDIFVRSFFPIFHYKEAKKGKWVQCISQTKKSIESDLLEMLMCAYNYKSNTNNSFAYAKAVFLTMALQFFRQLIAISVVIVVVFVIPSISLVLVVLRCR